MEREREHGGGGEGRRVAPEHGWGLACGVTVGMRTKWSDEKTIRREVLSTKIQPD